MTVLCRRTAFFAVCLAVALPASAQMYKWTDANGRVQYSDRPPSHQQAKVLGRSGTPAPAPTSYAVDEPDPAAADSKAAETAKAADGADPAAPKSWADKEQEFRKRRMEAEEERQKQAKLDAQKQAQAENCARTRNYLKTVEGGRRISRTNDKGEIEYLDDAQIRAEAERARQDLSQHCN